ncbi:MAG: hypothetical protein J0I77_20165 [Rudaea sp.]|uniref:hypothetical protein n=1 Tax=unclassified Rudaea TaxID=2627037 RepID=UPI0010F9EBA7|nr:MULTISPECIES: hypothetical protein [unclassified Rudaea]MBN8888039.1 hypothetical protein [Rudaea sp.]MBR0343671.1 hypothetical protein [Rudaea sp.]
MLARGSLLAVILFVAGAVTAKGAQPDATYAMSAVGEIQISPDGHVSDYKLRSQLPNEIATLVDKNIRGWTFEPIQVDGHAVTAKTAVNMQLKAEPVTGDQYKVRIVGVHFGSPMQSRAQIRPPRYPPSAVRAHVGGKVLLSVRLDETGKVVEAMPYQTSLDVRTSNEREAQEWRKLLESASIDAAKRWQYDLTETINGKPIGTSAIVPVEFWLDRNGPHDGRWKGYIPGPVTPAPWMHKEQVADNQSLSDLQNGESLSLDSRFKLKDDVVGKTL